MMLTGKCDICGAVLPCEQLTEDAFHDGVDYCGVCHRNALIENTRREIRHREETVAIYMKPLTELRLKLQQLLAEPPTG